MTEQVAKYRKVIFVFIMVLIPVLIFTFFEVGLRIANYGNDLRLFKKSVLYPGYYEINKEVGKRYFAKFKETTPTNDIFMIQKPDSCYRIFVLGCSTTRGFPYQSGTMFSRILYYKLQDVFPNKRIEVINLAFSAINSYSVADMIDEVLDNKPDAILIYTGHNEYYGALGVGSVENGGNYIWLKKVHLSLIHFKTYQLLQRVIAWSAGKLASNTQSEGTLMERIVKEKKIAFGSKLYYGGIEQFEYNINEVVEKAKNKGVPVVLSELVSNFRDQSPFVTDKENPLMNADYYFNKARDYEQQKLFDSAKANYVKAKDLDMLRFRAPEALNTTIHQLGEKYNVPVVAMIRYFEKKSPNGLIGDNLMLEHLHPNIEGYFIMADAFFNILKENQFISEHWDSARIKPISYYRNNWGFTPFDSLVGDLKIKMLKAGWPFKPENQRNNFQETYVPYSFEDTVAFEYVCSSNLHIEDKHVYLAGLYAQKGQYKKAFNEYYSLIKCYPYANTIYYDAALQLISAKDYNQADFLIHSMPNKDTTVYFYYLEGVIYARLNSMDKALTSLQKSLLLNPGKEDKILVLQELKKAYNQLGDSIKEKDVINELNRIKPESAVKASVQTNEKKPQNEAILKAEMLAAQGRLDEAEAVILKLLKKEESSAAYQILGAIYFKKKDFKAYDYYLKAYKLDSKNAETINNLFLLCMQKKDYSEAQGYLEKLKGVSNDYARLQRYEQYLLNAIQK
jgi:tetratricopeptide (TPR) repeat protein